MRARYPDHDGTVVRYGVEIRYGAGQCMDYATTDPDLIADLI
jgi:hypothetical protein